ncbi:helix-turn-helix transcriptional regulator [Paraglaciecola sp.]|uniref:helix-turn-helix transcriptional regulator n=1 Tax=Paraglaciecola sp. TaxID=1920173 RepID=UPI003EF429F0
MGEFIADWNIIFHNIVPFASAQVFLVVLIYFTIVRDRIVEFYPYYATFLVCFFLYLSSTLVNILPLGSFPYVMHYTACTLLYTIGFPALLVALFIQSKVALSKAYIAMAVALGLIWSVLYIVAADYLLLEVNIFAPSGQEGTPPAWLNFHNLYYFQSIIICLVLIFPGFYLLTKTNNLFTRTYIYGMLSLACFAVIGSTIEQWAIFYGGSSLCAIAWTWAMFNDIRQQSEKLKEHSAYIKSLAVAQYASSGDGLGLEDLYPNAIDESYPFREREELQEVLKTSSVGLLESKVNNMMAALEKFANNNEKVLKARVKEVLYLSVDTCIYIGAPAKELVLRLEAKGKAVEACNGNTALGELLLEECMYLANSLAEQNTNSGTNALVERMKSYVLANYNKESLNIDSIAEAIGVSRSHAMKSYKNKYGQTLNQYIIELRLEKAKSFLLEKSVTEAAYEVGFKSANYFSTFFSKHMGITPKQYQQQAKGQKSSD